MSKEENKREQFARRDTFQVPKVNLCWNFSPSWWEGLGVIIFYFGQKIVFWGLAIYLFIVIFK
jgi:hypothetical protein